MNLTVDPGKYPERLVEVLQEELVEKRREIESLRKENRSLLEQKYANDVVFDLLLRITGTHEILISDHVLYSWLFMKDKDVIENFARYCTAQQSRRSVAYTPYDKP